MPAVEVRTTESRRWRRGLRQHRTLGDNNCTGAVGGTGGAPSVVVVENDTGNMHTPGLMPTTLVDWTRLYRASGLRRTEEYPGAILINCKFERK